MKVLGRFESAHTGPPRFLWRIAAEPTQRSENVWPSLDGFSHRSLRYISLGQYGFVAADLHAREAVCVLPESLCADEIGFSMICLAGMLHLSAPALGLTAISAACVARGRNGLLLFGPPGSGKTTSSYWSHKLGLRFHSDQATFLDAEGGVLRAWGDFWPVAFREETAAYLPEIVPLARPFRYQDKSLLCVDRSLLPLSASGKVIPAACIFLERKASSRPRLQALRKAEMRTEAFTGAGSQGDREAILSMLEHVPAYRLLYDDDPRIAAHFFRSVLDAHQLMEQRS
jgi:hypothetical protein